MTNVSSVLRSDHRQQQELWERCLKIAHTLKALELDRLHQTYKELVRSIRSHIEIEENELIPLLQQAAGDTATSALLKDIRSEHREIESTIESLKDLERAREYSTVVQLLEGHYHELGSLLASHWQKEEDWLYPLIEATIGAERSVQLADEISKRIGIKEGNREAPET